MLGPRKNASGKLKARSLNEGHICYFYELKRNLIMFQIVTHVLQEIALKMASL